MADYIGISKPLAVIGVTPKPEINYFYGPWESVEETLDNIPQLARIKGLTVGIIEGPEIVEYWFKNGEELVLKSIDPTLVYTADEIRLIINSLDTKIDTKVDKVTDSRLITGEEATKLAEAITRPVFEEELTDRLATKVDVTANQRLITEEEATKLDNAVTPGDLESYSLKNIEGLEEVLEVPKEEDKYIKFFDEETGEEKKISMPNFTLSVSSSVYPTARTLEGDKNGMNETFTSGYEYIAGSEKLNINGCIYYPNSGFYREGNNIIISGAPIPEAGDFMFLEAIYLD